MKPILNGLSALWLGAFCAAAYAQSALPDFTRLVEEQGNAVVNISTSQAVRRAALPQVPGPDDDDALDFFRRFVPRPPPGEGRRPESRSLGSGFIISSDGYIMTNAHVIDGADEINVRLTDKREYKARVVGSDRRTDVALIKIEGSSLPAVKFGDPSKLKVGEWVLAIGSPFGFENTVTAGIVSAKGRSLPQETLVPFIQSDVAINPGNSGGPLFNMAGEVIGVNSQIYSRTGGFMGLSFAIPADVALDVERQLREKGRVSRGRIGVVIQEVTRDLATSFGLDRPRGALVNAVEPGGPAERAGIQPSDIIVAFGGKPVESSSELPRMVSALQPGTHASVEVWRDAASRSLSLTVAELPDERNALRPARSAAPVEHSANRLGIVVAELSAQQKRDLDVKGGLLVTQVRTGARADLREGDVLLVLVHKGRRTPLQSVEQFNRLLGGLEKDAVLTLEVKRGAALAFVTVSGLAEG